MIWLPDRALALPAEATVCLLASSAIIVLASSFLVQVKDQGYEVCHNGDCITVFSAPNYCDQMGNKGELMSS